MAKAEWGGKHICAECGTKYYDLGRKPINCPKCGAVPAPEPPPKSRRASTPAKAKEAPKPKPPPKPKVVAAAEDDPVKELADGADVKNDDDEEGDDLIEDASELGEDEDDMAEVIDSSTKEKEDR